jgi:hypothetical protein
MTLGVPFWMRLWPVAKTSPPGNPTSTGGESGGSFVANATLCSQHLPGNPRVSASLFSIDCSTACAEPVGQEIQGANRILSRVDERFA